MTKVTIEEAQAHLAELIDHLGAGEELIVVRGDQPIARIQAEQPPAQSPRVPGSARGRLTILADDKAHLADFAEYIE